MLRMVSKQYDNAIFVDLESFNFPNVVNIREICQQINSVLDQLDYNSKYLTYTKHRINNRTAGRFNNLSSGSRRVFRVDIGLITQTDLQYNIPEQNSINEHVEQASAIENENANQFFRE